jgi:hypothetical protein
VVDARDVTVPIDPDRQVVVYWADLTLWQASKYALDRETYWVETMLPIRATFGMSHSAYWDMTVTDHADMVTFLGIDEGE